MSKATNLKNISTTATTCRVLHSCNIGDLISSLPACKSYYEKTGKKIIYSQRINMEASYYPGATHPTENEGKMVSMNDRMFDMVKPLIESQPYIHSFEKFEGQPVDLDFNVIRNKLFVNTPHGSIQAWLFFAYHDLAYDLTKAWIELPKKKYEIQEQTKGKIIVNFTERYRNQWLTYHFLKPYEKELVFAGTEREYLLFVNTWGLDIPRLDVNDFLELAYAIKAARFTHCNQSMIWNLCEAMRTKRLLEVCSFAQNCLPFYGEDSLGYFHQAAAEWQFRELYDKTK